LGPALHPGIDDRSCRRLKLVRRRSGVLPAAGRHAASGPARRAPHSPIVGGVWRKWHAHPARGRAQTTWAGPSLRKRLRRAGRPCHLCRRTLPEISAIDAESIGSLHPAPCRTSQPESRQSNTSAWCSS
jgi:hypothetical protein